MNNFNIKLKLFFFLAIFFMLPNFARAIDLTACGTISSAGTYTLQNDVTSDGTCFFVSANDVTLDLNGNTITYDNAAPLAVGNGSFESTDLSDWDLSGASAAERSAGTYLGRTVYDGDYALKIPMPLTQDQILTTSGTYALRANTSYSASMMLWQPYNIANAANADLHVYTEIIDAADDSVLASRDSREIVSNYTARGLQYIRAPYTTTSSVNVKIRLRVTGGSTVTNVGQAPYGAIYFDDVRIQQTGFIKLIQNPGNNGIKFGGDSLQYGIVGAWARRGTITSTGGSKGKIIQGQAHGDFSDAVIIGGIPSDLNNYTVNNLEITVFGNSTHAIWASNAANGVISNNLIHGLGDTIESRDHYDGALIKVDRADPATGVAGKILDNVITNGIQTGIYVAGSPSASMLTEIYGNDITLQSKYTNDFGIVGGYGTYSAHIHDNFVRCGSGNDTCRGISIHGNNGIIEDNDVEVHYRKNNQEYGIEYAGCGGAAYGIQVDIASSNVETKNNTVTAYADECEAAAFRFYAQPVGTTINNSVHDNTFKAISLGGSDKLASTVRVIESYASDMSFFDNILITNSAFLHLDGNVAEDDGRGLILDHNNFQIDYPKSAMYYPLVSQSYLSGTYSVPKNITISNNVYADAAVRSDMSAAVFYNARNNYLPDTFASNIIVSEFAGSDVTAPSTPSGLSVM